MCAASVPQQPPIMLTPSSSTKRSSHCASSAGPERVMGVAGDELGQAGIGLDRDQPGPVLAEPLDVLGHLARTGGAVEPDHRHVERLDHRRRGGDVGADQQCAGRLDRDLDEDRRVLARVVARALGAVDRGLDLQRVLAGLDDDRIDPAGDQPGALRGERVLERLVGDVAERGQAGPRPDRAEHEAGAAVIGRTRRPPRAPARRRGG